MHVEIRNTDDSRLFLHRPSVNRQLAAHPRIKISTRLAQNQISTRLTQNQNLNTPRPESNLN